MSVSYKVWIEVEEVTNEDKPNEHFETMDMPFSATASGFPTLEAAMDFARRLHDKAEELSQ